MGRNADRAVELAGGVFPGDRSGQFHDSVVVEMLPDAGKELVVDVLIGKRDCVSVGERGAFRVGKQRTRRVVGECVDLLVRDAGGAANGSVDVLSELASVVRGHPAIDERDHTRIEQAGRLQSAPHPAHRSKDRWTPGVNQIPAQELAPRLHLRGKCGFDRGIKAFVGGIDALDAHGDTPGNRTARGY